MSETKAAIQVEDIRRVVNHLNEDWIVEGCGDYPPVMGCASCRAHELKEDLKMLARSIYENDDIDATEIEKW